MTVKQTKHSKWIALTAMAALLSLITPGQAEETESIRHMGIFHDLRYTENIKVSWAGGTILQFNGNEFDNNPVSNQVLFETSEITGAAQTIAGALMNDQDEFRSEPSHSGKLSYTMPHFNVLGEKAGLPEDWMNSFEYLSMYTTVSHGGKVDKCAVQNNCRVIPDWSYTPISYGTTPSVLYPGQKVTYIVDPKASCNRQLPGSFLHAIDVKIDDVELDMRAYQDEEVTNQAGTSCWTKNYIEGHVQTQHRNLNSKLVGWMHGVGDAYRQKLASQKCSFDNTDCYDVRIMPSITDITASGGYTSGGQEITITGTSLDGTTIAIEVDGAACQVTSSSKTQITCMTSEKVLGATQSTYVGQHGLRRKFFDDDTTTLENFDTIAQSMEVLMTNFEVATTKEDYLSVNVITGFFEAPVDGQYQFHMSCDDDCNLYMSTSDPMNPSAKELLMSRSGHATSYDFRDFSNYKWSQDYVGSIFSEWITLAAGEKYYIEGNHQQKWSRSHFSVGVEITPTNLGDAPSNNPVLTPQLQRLEVSQDITRDTTKLTVQGADGLNFLIMFEELPTDPPAESPTNFKSELIAAGCSANDLKSAITDYYASVAGLGVYAKPSVTLRCLDDTNTERDCSLSSYWKSTCIDTPSTECDSCQDDSGAAVACTDVGATKCVTAQPDLGDSIQVGGKTWAELKVSAIDAGYSAYSTYQSMSAEDQALVNALIAAQSEQGDENVLVSTLTSVDLTDATTVDGTTWADLKAEATAVDYDTSVWTGDNLALVDALIEAQAAQGDSLTLGATTYTTGHDYSDSSALADGTTTWAFLKTSAMDAGYDSSSLSAADQALFDALAAAQTTQGNEASLDAVPYNAATACTLENTEMTYDPVYEYTIEQVRSINGPSCRTAQAVSQGSLATITLQLPEDLGLVSNTPLNGYYFIECYEVDDSTPKYTRAISASETDGQVAAAIFAATACPSLRNKFSVIKEQAWNEDSLSWVLNFENVDGNLDQFKIYSVDGVASYSDYDALAADSNLVLAESQIQQRGPNVYYEVLPFEMLYTDESTPQVMATIDTQAALCASLSCGYVYEDSTAEITGMTVTDLDVSITGTGLSTTITSVKFGETDCLVTLNDATSISCTLESPMRAGTWKPHVKDSKGLLPRMTGLAGHTVGLVVDSVAPTTNLNPAGGNIITITGSGFPSRADTTGVSLDINGAPCKLVTSTSTEMTCRTSRFSNGRRRLQFGDLQFNLFFFNMIEALQLTPDEFFELITASETVEETPNPMTIESMTPTSASPILIETFVIQLGSGTEYDSSYMNTDTFNVNIVPTEGVEGGKTRALNVVEVDSDNMQLTVKYGGAQSGIYNLEVSYTRCDDASDATCSGNFLVPDTLTFEAKIHVMDFNPKQGSVFGGSLVTITGGHFSDIPTDNPVKFGYNWVGGVNHYCYVQTSSDSEIVCRMATDHSRTAGDAEVIVFASTSEEATWESGVDKNFNFLPADQLPMVTSFATGFNADNTYHMNISGTGITGVDTIKIGGIAAEVLSVTETLIEIRINELESGSGPQEIEIYLTEGVPDGMLNPLFSDGVTFDPALIELSSSSGSAAGSTIYAKIEGRGSGSSTTLVDTFNNDICMTATMIEYSILECVTLGVDMDTVQLSVKDVDTNIVYDCANSDTTQCEWGTVGSGLAPIWTAVSSSDNVVTFQGTNLDLYGTDCLVHFLGVPSDSCTVTATTASATFTDGLLVTDTSASPTLELLQCSAWSESALCDSEGWYAYNAELAKGPAPVEGVEVGLTNPFTMTNDAGTALECSFAGGCVQTINAQGLTLNVKEGRAEVNVCGKPCTMVDASSDASSFACKVPSIQSQSSINSFTIEESGPITGSPIQSDLGSNMGLAFDGNNLPAPTDTGANCYIGTMFEGDDSGYMVGILSEVRFFMNYFADRSVYDGNLKLQGSNTGFQSDDTNDIITISAELHEGWNYYRLEDLLEGTNVSYPPKYRYYRLFNEQMNGCDGLGEINFIGQKAFETEETSHSCSIVVSGDDFPATTLTSTVNYMIYKTPYVTAISPRWGTVEGGTSVTITGVNFKYDNGSNYVIEIDDIPCAVTSASTTYVTCVTGARIGLWEQDPKLSIHIDGYGNAANQGHEYRYVSLWSSLSTWGNLFPPVDGESVAVQRGVNLLVDIDHSPLLKLVVVDGGSLIFPSDSNQAHERTFDAHYIFLNNNALMEVGTEDEPYSSKLTITMHGNKNDPYIPKFGNKCIGVRFSTLDIHGTERDITWTSLETTALAGSETITLREAVDWQVGEKIVIASTDLGVEDNHQPGIGDMSEQRTIKTISADQTVITFDGPLLWEHYANTDTYGYPDMNNMVDSIEMRAEVGLLTRNVKYQGDETSNDEEYGATIMLHSPGDESVIGRISYAEFFNVGQAFQLGRYPIHFHMIGEVNKSYVIGNAIHNSFNRGTTIHGVHYLRVTHNVLYHCKGHNIFIEDAIETNNYIAYNLVMQVRSSMSLLNTDTTPAAFWITNPNNIFVGNHVAGGDRYGFWFDLQVHPMGPSATTDICPISVKLGEFRDNAVHSVGRYGLRIFHEHTPRTRPCDPITFDDSVGDEGNPYWENPVIPAVYENFVAWKCGRNGVIAEDIGAVRFENIRTCDNTLAGIEVNRILDVRDDEWGGPWVKGALLIGRSHKSEAQPETFRGIAQDSAFLAADISPHGIITAQRDFWQVKDASFYNYNFNQAAAFGSCSHCFKVPATDSDGRTTKMSGIKMDGTVTRKIRHQFPFKSIFYDSDNSWLSQGDGGWTMSALWTYNNWDTCTEDTSFDGYLCANTVSVRSLVFYNASPDSLMNTDLWVLPYDSDIIGDMDATALLAYEADESNYGVIPFRSKDDPESHWKAPFVTGHTYYLRWSYGLDFEQMRIEIVEPLWTLNSDKDIHLEIPFYDVRESINIDTAPFNDRIGNMTLSKHSYYNKFGANNCFNNTFEEDEDLTNDKEKRLQVAISAKANTEYNQVATDGVTSILMTGVRPPTLAGITDLALGDAKNWSDPTAWKFEPPRIPQEGDDIVIDSEMNILYDVADGDSVILGSLEINGQLTFTDGVNRQLNTYRLWVRAGTLNIGSAEQPFASDATITLWGDNTQDYWSFTTQIEAGNKNLIITGTVNLYGSSRSAHSRLLETARKNNKQIKVESGLDWKVGEVLGLAATNMRSMDFDYCEIDSYNSGTGVVECKESLVGYHYGALQSGLEEGSSFKDYTVDMRGEVVLLARNVLIQASTSDIGPILNEPWGCRILVSDFWEPTLVKRTGSLMMDNAQVKGCSQKSTYKSAIKWEQASGSSSSVSNSVISSGKGMGIIMENSAGVTLLNNILADFVQQGIWIKDSQEITLDGNQLHHVIPKVDEVPLINQWPILADYFVGGITASEGNSKMVVQNNIVSGAWQAAFHFRPNHCDLARESDKYVFKNNVAHSISGNGAVAKNVQNSCTTVGDFVAYKCTHSAIMLGGPSEMNEGRNLRSIDNHYGIAIHSAGGGQAELHTSKVFGSNMDNEDCPEGRAGCDHCISTRGVVLNQDCDDTHLDSQKKWFKHPLWKKCNGGTRGQMTWIGLEFINWESSTKSCGAKQFGVGPWKKMMDYNAFAEFKNPVFNNVVESAIAYLPSPQQSWANWEDCGIDFTCTGLYNIVIRYEGATFINSAISGLSGKNFNIIAKNAESDTSAIFEANGECVSKTSWNGYLCKDNDKFGMLIIDSLDDDRMDRSSQPLYIHNDDICATLPPPKGETCFKNRLNAMADHCWDGFYTCQEREQRFPTMVQQRSSLDTYWVEYTGTPPEAQEFVLHGAAGTPGFMVQVKYSGAGAYYITNDNGDIQQPTLWDDSIKNYQPLQRQRCGENRYLGVLNILEFFITPDCPLFVRPRDAIMLGIRLEFPMAEFFTGGGVTSFIDNMAGVLGIHKADLKVVSVYEGSTIIDFQVISNFIEEIPLNLETVQQTFETFVSTADVFMGSTLLSAVSSGIPIVTPNTPTAEQGVEIDFEDLFNFGDDDDDSTPVIEEAPVDIDFVYNDITVNQYGAKQSQDTTGYVAIIGMIMIVIILIGISVCLYRKIISQYEVSQTGVPKAVVENPEFDEMHGLEKQYTPNPVYEKANRKSDGFGGKSFNRNAKTNAADDVVPWSSQKLKDTEGDCNESSIPIGLPDQTNRSVDQIDLPHRK